MAGLSNKDLARVFKEIELLQLVLGADERRARSYGRMSRLIEGLDRSAADLAAAGRLVEVKGLGPKAQTVVAELVDRGSCDKLDELVARVPPGVPEILRVPGLGPKRVHTVLTELGVESLEQLAEAAEDGRLAGLKGFGPKMAHNVVEGIEFLARTRSRRRCAEACALAAGLIEELRLGASATLAGQLRRGCPVVDTIAIVVPGDGADARLDGFERDGAAWVRPRGAGPGVRVRFAAPDEWTRALFEETGPAEHVAAVLARPGEDGDEDEIYTSRGLHPVPPERRHACDGTEPVPPLVATGDVHGLVHAHTTWSDGRLSLADMAAAAHERGYAYLGVTDHSRIAVYARGLEIDRLQEQAAEIRAFNAQVGPVRVLHGTEVDILPDGALDYPDDVLAELDFVIASIHSSFTQDEDAMTARLVAAVRNPHVDILGHPTGRLLLRRDGYPVDMDRVLAAAAESGTSVELNANPWRLDLDPALHARARELGVKVPIAPDAHSAEGMDDVAWGVLAARHGGLTAADVPNTAETADGFLAGIGR